MNIVDMFEGPAHDLVWTNHFNEITDDVYKKYIKDSEELTIVD